MAITRYAGDKIVCLSSDVFPTNISDGATLFTLDTHKVYVKQSGAWNISLAEFDIGDINTTPATSSTDNSMSGRVRISGGNGQYVITNSLVTENSIVLATINTQDSSAISVRAIPSNGSLLLELGNQNATSDCDISWFVVKT